MLTGKGLAIHLLDGKMLISLAGIAMLTGLISGSYPALFLSGFAPVKVLKGKMRVAGGNLIFRNSLVVTQFVVAIVLLVGTTVVYKQLNFIKKPEPWFRQIQPAVRTHDRRNLGKQQALKATLAQNPLTENFSIISELPTAIISGSTDVVWDGQAAHNQMVIPSLNVDENFTKVFKTHLLAGRGFCLLVCRG